MEGLTFNLKKPYNICEAQQSARKQGISVPLTSFPFLLVAIGSIHNTQLMSTSSVQRPCHILSSTCTTQIHNYLPISTYPFLLSSTVSSLGITQTLPQTPPHFHL